ncbi:MAG: hypothetical protein ACKOOI_14765, partial [Pirellula sp.]
PPELLRKGRLDEIFFVDLPDHSERKEIFAIHLKKRDRDPTKFDLARLSDLTAGFNGAEIEEAIVSAMFDEFSGQVAMDTKLLETSVRETVPLSKTMHEELSRLREWSQGRARPASKSATIDTQNVSRRKIEL